MNNAHIYVSGFVQGVGYRNFTKHHARKLQLTGWVQNLPDGRVEALVQGPKHKIEVLIKILKKGPFTADVESVDVLWEESGEEFIKFEVKKNTSS